MDRGLRSAAERRPYARTEERPGHPACVRGGDERDVVGDVGGFADESFEHEDVAPAGFDSAASAGPAGHAPTVITAAFICTSPKRSNRRNFASSRK